MASLMRWEPFRDLMSLQRDVDRLFSDVGILRPLTATGPGMTVPSVDVFTRGEDLVVRAEIPGVKPSDIDISVTDGVLTLKAERSETHEVKEEDYLIRESSYGTYERSLRLPEGAEVEKIHADYTDGILEVTVPRGGIEHGRTHRIAIESHTPSGQTETH